MKNFYDIERFGGNRKVALERDGFKCVSCGISMDEHKKKYGRELTVDHIDGSGRNSKIKNHELSNLQTLCLACHGKKDHRPRRIKKHQLKVLKVLVRDFELAEGGAFFNFRYLTKATGLNKRTVRLVCRYLRRSGYARFCSGLCTEDGEFAGSGYSATEEGIKFINPEE